MEVVWGQPKWIITNHTKCQSSSKEGDVVYMVGFAGNPLLWAFPGKPNDSFQQVLYPVRPTESSSQTENALSSIRITQDRMFLWWPGKSCSSLAEKFWYIHCIHQTLHLWCPFILVFTKFSSWKKKFNSLEDYKRHPKQLFAQKDKFWEDRIMKSPEKWQNIVKQNGKSVV